MNDMRLENKAIHKAMAYHDMDWQGTIVLDRAKELPNQMFTNW